MIVKVELCILKKDFTWYKAEKEISISNESDPNDAIPSAVTAIISDLEMEGKAKDTAYVAAPKVLEVTREEQ